MAYDKAQSLVLRYCDTSFGWHTNRQSVVVRYDHAPEESPHVTLQSPDTVFVNDDDDGDARTNDFENASFNSSKVDDDIVPVVVGFKSVAYPNNYPADRISWTCSDPGVKFIGADTGKTVRVRATSAATGGYFDIRFGDCPSLSPQIRFKVCDLRSVVVSPVFVATQNSPYTFDGATALTNAVKEANDIFSQAGVQIVMNEPVVIELDQAFTPDYNDDASIERLYALTNSTALRGSDNEHHQEQSGRDCQNSSLRCVHDICGRCFS